MPELYQLTLPDACCGLVVRAGIVTEAAPIVRWAVGKVLGEVMRWARGKGGALVLVEEG